MQFVSCNLIALWIIYDGFNVLFKPHYVVIFYYRLVLILSLCAQPKAYLIIKLNWIKAHISLWMFYFIANMTFKQITMTNLHIIIFNLLSSKFFKFLVFVRNINFSLYKITSFLEKEKKKSFWKFFLLNFIIVF